MDWNADLGARHRMDWQGFLARHQKLLQPLVRLARLGRLDGSAIDLVCEVVSQLEAFKRTTGRTLVFGSKAAHFHFPWLVPVMSSEVATGLTNLEARYPDEVAALVGGDGRRFRFSSPDARRRAYKNYLSLGNAMMKDVDTKKFLGAMSSATFDLHAKVFEWWVIASR